MLPVEQTEDAGHLSSTLSSARFEDSIYITRCNEPVGTYAMDRARLFAQSTQTQLLWIQAEDYLDDPHFAAFSEMAKKTHKARWMHPRFHARRTGGIPSLLPLC